MAKKAARRHTKKQGTKSTRKRLSSAKLSSKKRAGKGKAGAGVSSGGKARALTLLKWTHEMTGKLADGFLDHQATFQTTPTDNHLIWTLGHLATSYSWFAGLIDGKAANVPESYNALFGWGAKPTADATAYPSLGEVREVCEKAFKRMTDALAGLTEAELAKPTVTPANGFATDRLDVAYKAAWHEGWHQGQIATLRRALGMKSIY